MNNIYHIFSEGNNFYLYLTENKQLFKISSTVYAHLLNGDDADAILSHYLSLINEIDNNPTVENTDKQFGLYLCVANACNSKCIYCFAEHGTYGKSMGIMDTNIVSKAIDYFMTKCPESEKANIIFFGGEPIIAFDKIKYACKYFNENYKSRKHLFHIVTNATLLTPAMIDFFKENEFSVAVSIDGGKDVQNVQRPLVNGNDSFVEATKYLPYLLNSIKTVNARGTYYNINFDLVQIHKDLLNLGFNEINVPPDILHLNSMADFEKIEQEYRNLKSFILSYCRTNTDFPFGLFTKWIRRIYLPKVEIGYGCNLGKSIFSIDINGNIYPCHRFTTDNNECLGNLKKLSDRRLESENNLDSTHSSCQKCWNKYTCSHGCKYNDEHYSKNKGEKNPYWCLFSKLMTELSLDLCASLPSDHIEKILKISS